MIQTYSTSTTPGKARPSKIRTRRARWCTASMMLLLGWVGIAGAQVPSGPELEVWHGLKQRVGHLGRAQHDFNVLGNVSDPDGVASLTYRLNGGEPQPLTVRPSFEEQSNRIAARRLAAPGDFNADIPLDSLRLGPNSVELVARDELGNETSVTVTVDRQTGHSALPYGIDWSEVDDPQDVGQYVDGNWVLEEDGLRIRRPGYDRLFLIGEAAWQDYEVTVPITVNRLDTVKWETSGVGLLMRFTGHVVASSDPDAQPKWGYRPNGGIGWPLWGPWKPTTEKQLREQFFSGADDGEEEWWYFDDRAVEIGTTYMMKMRAETQPDAPNGDGVTRYSWKMWEAGTPEPTDWDWEVVQTSPTALRRGGVALIAHFVDATFGDVLVTSLDEAPPAISNVEITPSERSAMVTWTTDEPTLTQIAYGTTEAYGSVVDDRTTKTEHAVRLDGLDRGTTYHFAITSSDLSGNATTTDDATFETEGRSTLPVELVQFEALTQADAVLLTWRTASETSNSGFEVQHRRADGEKFVRLGFVEGAGTTTEAQHYRYRAAGLPPGTHRFRLKQIDFDGDVSYSGEVMLEVDLPTRYHLSEARPNPFNPRTQFEMAVQTTQQVRAEVYNMLGRRVAVLYDGEAPAGTSVRLTFEAASLGSGSYVLRVEGETFTATRRMVLLK